MNKEKVLTVLLELNMLFDRFNLDAVERQRVIQLFIQLDSDCVKL